jgi:hypothetical protein
VEEDAGPKLELPAVVVAFGLPFDGEGGTDGTVGIKPGEAVVDQGPSEAVGAIPGVAFHFGAKRAAVMRAGARGGGERKGEE